MSEPRTVIYQCDYWEYKEGDDGKLTIISGGRTADNKVVLTKIEGFTPFVYVELPRRIKWNATKGKQLFNYFKNMSKRRNRNHDEGDYEDDTEEHSKAPLTYSLKQKFKLHHKKLINTMLLTFPNKEATQKFQGACARRSLYIEGLGAFKPGEFIVHEHNIDPIMKLTATKKIKLSGWVQVKEKIREEDEGLTAEERNFSSVDIGMYADWHDFNPYEQPKGEIVILRRKYMGFDIESNSKNKNSKLPDPKIPENKCFQISMTFGIQGEDKSKRKKYLLTLFNPLDVEGVEVRRFSTEGKLLLDFARIVNEENPDILIGYNIMKFDWNYMLERAEFCGVYLKFAQMTRIVGERAVPKKISWSSSAYGEQNFRYLELTGRTPVDVILEIERNFKLDTYTLNAVSKHFLKQEKEDLSALELFMLYEYTEVMTPLVEKLKAGTVDRAIRVKLKKRVQAILPIRKCGKQVLALRKEFLDAKTGETFRQLVRKAMWLIGVYCVQDTNLAVDLVDHLNLWTNMEEMANVMHVPVSYLHTRGQQIKVLAQVYRETISSGIVIPFRSKSKDSDTPDERFQGAIVQDAVPGDYDNVGTGDFESLYPSMMINGNICYTTLLEDNDPTPDSECNVFEWEDHVGCEHDPQHRKKKKEDILCKKHRYRFRKVVYLPDGTKLHEGLMPRLVRNLLVERKAVKKEMAKLQARLNMHLGKVEEKDLEYFKKMGWEIITKGSLNDVEVEKVKAQIVVLNAKQNALKVSANSAYGGLGAVNGFIPLVPGAATVTYLGRAFITEAIRFIVKIAAPRRGVEAKLVYGDTDSCMINLPGKSVEESYVLFQELTAEASHYLKCWSLGFEEDYSFECPSEKKMYRIDKYPRNKMAELSDELKIHIYQYDGCPVNLAFENLYGRYLLLSKKRYVAYAVNRKGEVLGAPTKKGVALARRDNSRYLRDTYSATMLGILDKKSEAEVMNIVYDEVHKLFTRQIPDSKLVIYVGIKTVMNYAKKVEKKKGKQVISRTFVDADKNPIEDPSGPLDPRLVYPNIPQCLLALKMLRRGDDIPPNTRLEFLYLENEEAEYQGEKAEDFTYYRENKADEGLRPDYFHYIEKQLCNPITELLTVKFPHEKIMWEKLDDAFDRLVGKLDELNRFRVVKVKEFTKEISCQRCKAGSKVKCVIHRKVEKPRIYITKKKMAQVEHILDSVNKFRSGVKNEINPDRHRELVSVCRRMKSRDILDRLYKMHGLRKRTERKPTQTGKLRVNTEVKLTKKIGSYEIGSEAKVVEITEIEDSKKEFIYKIRMVETEEVLEDLPRNAITSWYYRDSKVLEDIQKYRMHYRDVVKQVFDLNNVELVFPE